MAYFCSHAIWKKDDPQMYCDNAPDEKNPIPADNEERCKICSVGWIRRLRDGWDDWDYSYHEEGEKEASG